MGVGQKEQDESIKQLVDDSIKEEDGKTSIIKRHHTLYDDNVVRNRDELRQELAKRLQK